MSQTYRMLTPPMVLWGTISTEQWQNMSDVDCDNWVKIAKEQHDKGNYGSEHIQMPNAKLIINEL